MVPWLTARCPDLPVSEASTLRKGLADTYPRTYQGGGLHTDVPKRWVGFARSSPPRPPRKVEIMLRCGPHGQDLLLERHRTLPPARDPRSIFPALHSFTQSSVRCVPAVIPRKVGIQVFSKPFGNSTFAEAAILYRTRYFVEGCSAPGMSATRNNSCPVPSLLQRLSPRPYDESDPSD
jgi:hypothetical protein